MQLLWSSCPQWTSFGIWQPKNVQGTSRHYHQTITLHAVLTHPLQRVQGRFHRKLLPCDEKCLSPRWRWKNIKKGTKTNWLAVCGILYYPHKKRKSVCIVTSTYAYCTQTYLQLLMYYWNIKNQFVQANRKSNHTPAILERKMKTK
jgi:hypothetical protein